MHGSLTNHQGKSRTAKGQERQYSNKKITTTHKIEEINGNEKKGELLARNLAPFWPHGVMRVRVLETCNCSLAAARDLIMLAIFGGGTQRSGSKEEGWFLPLMAADGACAGLWGLQLTGYRHRRRHASQTSRHNPPVAALRGGGCGVLQFLFSLLLAWSARPPAKRRS